jgi:hypothetical protein
VTANEHFLIVFSPVYIAMAVDYGPRALRCLRRIAEFLKD